MQHRRRLADLGFFPELLHHAEVIPSYVSAMSPRRISGAKRACRLGLAMAGWMFHDTPLVLSGRLDLRREVSIRLKGAVHGLEGKVQVLVLTVLLDCCPCFAAPDL